MTAGWSRIDLPGADVTFASAWLGADEADRLLDHLRQALPWEVHRIRMFGRIVDSPRLSAWIGDDDAAYRYSGTRFVPHPWTAELRALRDRVADACDAPFNSVLANLYRDGADRMGWHSDDEPELGARPVIASLSLGAERTFRFRAKAGGESVAIELPHGSLLTMAGDTQRLYKHELPARKRVTGPRINLTFRNIEPPRDIRSPIRSAPTRC
ncbi:alpha-ketoglutarate-dependent dioxygenase AlkB [Luteibacter sp. 329MFSha]|uniref:alpha-ketoglutarate-dependent dioxygenase AlkB family protein n=1 Tax=Luteibacter sp. 329MFSha TaxID=1798239 RepID=UPI0008D63C5F|nr:alpha-ketoglutarate-dependent dioxygenase AlkB [Luteibacter sp. 329MFSha]SEW16982.1 Alkylated DNA repair dioxygenase AlkB [Luteibacter sp. 329MFSha]